MYFVDERFGYGTVEEFAREAREGERVLSGSFYRRFSLPDTADSESVSAKSDHGVLEITVAKQEKTQPRKIAVHH